MRSQDLGALGLDTNVGKWLDKELKTYSPNLMAINSGKQN